ncbi:MAG: hypothetical protein AAF567_23955 [Actinomycetota bacterium]
MSLVRVVLYTEAHRISGAISLRERLNEALNDRLTDYLELNDVRISKLVDPTRAEVAWPTTVIPKNEIKVATLDTVTHESETSRIDKVTRKKGTELGCIIGTIELYGTGHLNFQSTAQEVLLNQLPPFFPVTHATLLFPAATDSRVDTQLAFANREAIRAFSLL